MKKVEYQAFNWVDEPGDHGTTRALGALTVAQAERASVVLGGAWDVCGDDGTIWCDGEAKALLRRVIE